MVTTHSSRIFASIDILLGLKGEDSPKGSSRLHVSLGHKDAFAWSRHRLPPSNATTLHITIPAQIVSDSQSPLRAQDDVTDTVNGNRFDVGTNKGVNE
ncbi:hypothetical protein HAPAU_34940 [Halalkalicoccus paucihalophilus]|uniref:Uncharacterized protein n=1 Tax=Halalkalicoccus paucihalophilus TaxID=1008153 RepID=A0A151A9Z9_9EURY|nr:hypothetical protein HAPAU_34940 [Halalkalicoccus paucihalophilus]